MSEKGELKPCPFCGGQDVFMDFDESDGVSWFWVRCLRCGCDLFKETSTEKAVSAWNTRADALNSAESLKAENGWIAIDGNENYPKTDGYYLVTFLNVHLKTRSTSFCFFSVKNDDWSYEEWLDFEIIAYRPLPEPYKGETK